MRFLGAILGIFVAFTAVASAHVDLCDLAKSPCLSSQIETCPNSSEEQESEETSHEHCKVHCSHQFIHFGSFLNVAFLALDSINDQPYSFELDQTYLDGPFRPPLV